MSGGLVGTLVTSFLGVGLLLAAALTFTSSSREALFLGGAGLAVLGVGGLVEVDVRGAAVVGGADFILMLAGALIP